MHSLYGKVPSIKVWQKFACFSSSTVKLFDSGGDSLNRSAHFLFYPIKDSDDIRRQNRHPIQSQSRSTELCRFSSFPLLRPLLSLRGNPGRQSQWRGDNDLCLCITKPLPSGKLFHQYRECVFKLWNKARNFPLPHFDGNLQKESAYCRQLRSVRFISEKIIQSQYIRTAAALEMEINNEKSHSLS